MRVHFGKPRRPAPDPLSVLPAFLELPHPFLLLSAMPGPDTGRFSFLGADPFLRFEARGRECTVARRDGGIERLSGDPLARLGELLARFRVEPHGATPLPGGAVGYAAYSLQWQARGQVPGVSGEPEPPDLWFGFYDRLLVFDHLEGTVTAAATGLPATDPEEREGRALRDLEDLQQRLRARGGRGSAAPAPVEFRPGIPFGAYRDMVCAAQDAIARGEIYQLNLTYPWRSGPLSDPAAAFRRLVRCSPAPFCAYLDDGHRRILSTSPERFLRWDGRVAESRPIKGTRPRGTDPAGDRLLRRELLASAKERAENIMIVDLIRNDLGRVCRPGTVRVRRLAGLETYARVFHLVSTVEGVPRPGVDAVDLIRALFPGGSMTGAPKIRCLEWIDRLEPVPRGIYSGTLGYLSFSGRTDLNIVIRTVVADRREAHFHVGGAVLADSDPEMEYRETLAKADGILRALGGAGARSLSE